MAPQATFKFRGKTEPEASPPALPLSLLRDRTTVRAEFRPGTSRAAAVEQTVSVDPNDILEMELAEGQRLWIAAQDYFEHYAPAPSRDAAGREVVLVPTQLPVLPRAMRTRGPVTWVVKSLKVLGVDLAKYTAAGIGQLLDTKTSVKRPGLGLHQCRAETGAFALSPFGKEKTKGDQPQLVFLHGPASSTWESFGDLWSTERSAELGALRDAYGESILAFEHPSLTVSPLRNAIDLLDALPRNRRLHLVAYSRGGLIGELLCRARNVAGAPFSTKEIEIYKKALEARSEELGEDLQTDKSVAELKELNRKLHEVHPVVERFVRVASPVLGTTLASRRLDRCLSVIGNLCSLALPATPLADWFSDIADFMATVITKRTDPATLPGLEAMMPDSGLVRVLNLPTVKVDGDLAVIAGDIDPDAWWAKLLIWTTDRFYKGDHDLVVNTPSMSGGAKRTGERFLSLHRGGSVNHFSYFSSKPSAEAVVRGLVHKSGDANGFEPLDAPTPEIARSVAVTSNTPRPVVFVLPGIMGSELSAGKDRIWLDVAGLIFGGFSKLAIDNTLEPVRPIPRYYAELINFLSATHQTIPFPFDWRLSIETEADRLADRIEAELKVAVNQGQPVSLLAHSMGGLVARTMIARHPDLWQRLCKHPQARLVMLGTPNGGAHAIAELLVGSSTTLSALAAVDIRQSKLQVLQLVSRFPGVLAMLPKDSRENYFSPQTWAALFKKAGKGWVLPQNKDLARAQRFREVLDQSPLDPLHMIYVAGSADMTTAAMEYDDRSRKIRFLGTTRGDGRVTWDSGIPEGVPTWYMDVEHGSLCADPPSFPAVRELLETGTTNLLSQLPKVSRDAAELFLMPEPSLELHPTDEVLATAVLGDVPKRRKGSRRSAKVPINVRLVHGNLAFCKYPVAVGHYSKDGIVSAEEYLDKVLSGELSRRNQLGLYPGAIGTSAIFINRRGSLKGVSHPGAIIVGLGTPGQLSAGALSRTFMRALLEYVLGTGAELPQFKVAGADAEITTVGVSALLIGSGAGGVNVSDCVFALLSGTVLANDALEQAKQSTRIGQLELFELWEDRAIQAAEALLELSYREDIKDKFTSNFTLDKTDGALRRIRYEDPPGWWHRLQILGGSKEGEAVSGTLRFSSSTRRARNEVRIQPTQRALVDSFIERAIRQTSDDSAVAGTLFELLLPNELKDQAPDRGNIVLLLDEEAARYPWELLRDPSRPGAPPVSVEQGILRQLESSEFRESVREVFDDTALVIGDPESPFPELPAARREAEVVSLVLGGRGRFNVDKRVRPVAQEVLMALYAKPYRILHLAGHGVYRFPRGSERITGMIIGDGVFLGPAEVRNMRLVPELVFINCCHLGRIESEGPQRTDFNMLAANVATEFIRAGVRAVVAAGWAVDDDAASVFARTFYEAMSSGNTFGRAVHKARIETHRQFPLSNTCGAYQCYGDPDWKLFPDSDEIDAGRPSAVFTSPMQAAIDLENIIARLKSGTLPEEQGQQTLKDLVARLDKAGILKDPLIVTVLGRAFGEAKMFTDAIRVLRDALSSDEGVISTTDIETLSNLEARDAVRVAREGDVARALKDVDTAIQRLTTLNTITAASSERLALLGSAYKRRAWISPDAKTRSESLVKSREFYKQAYDKGRKVYAFINLLSVEIVLKWHRRDAREIARLIARELPDNQQNLAKAFEQDRGFWNSAMVADLELLQTLANGPVKEEALVRISAAYVAAAERGSQKERGSVLEQVDFFCTMAKEPNPEVYRWLQGLLARVGNEPAEVKTQKPARARKRKK
jgi:pimeloyl-ACP methyl ester carboxylesterase